MDESSVSSNLLFSNRYLFSQLHRFARNLVFSKLQSLREGLIVVIDPIERKSFGNSAEKNLKATLEIHDLKFYSKIAFGGTIGVGEAFMDGDWSCEEIPMLVRIILRNQNFLKEFESGLGALTGPIHRLVHRFRPNCKNGMQKNISSHYDLGNDFFSLFLDDTLMYSCGIFDHESMSLKEASLNKIKRICKKLTLQPEDHLLEIGTGWGSFAIYAAQKYGCKVTTTTISKKQHEYAFERVKKLGLSKLVKVLFQDYRDLTGTYDKIVSIEMIEAIGEKYYDLYFKVCGELLKPNGMMLLQTITIADQYYDQARKSVDFMKRYIFPGSCIPSITALQNAITRSSDLKLFHLEDLTSHYAITLRKWRERFLKNIGQIRKLGFSDSFLRMWEFYLANCEGSFEERYIGDVQMLLTKPLCQRKPILPKL